ncbi:hypothetical protein [Actinophytocola sp.]|uniref:hypothetical protein n=1 Tax=Actinophytocola sp. TaxID=1872138 RepID=UPI002ED3B8F9
MPRPVLGTGAPVVSRRTSPAPAEPGAAHGRTPVASRPAARVAAVPVSQDSGAATVQRTVAAPDSPAAPDAAMPVVTDHPVGRGAAPTTTGVPVIERVLPLLAERPLAVVTGGGGGQRLGAADTAPRSPASTAVPARWTRPQPRQVPSQPAVPGTAIQRATLTAPMSAKAPVAALRRAPPATVTSVPGREPVPSSSAAQGNNGRTRVPRASSPAPPSSIRVQRVATGVSPGVPVTVVQRTPEDAGAKTGDTTPAGEPDPDLDKLARRLLEPVSRLLRAELRQGRERIGRLHDRHR